MTPAEVVALEHVERLKRKGWTCSVRAVERIGRIFIHARRFSREKVFRVESVPVPGGSKIVLEEV